MQTVPDDLFSEKPSEATPKTPSEDAKPPATKLDAEAVELLEALQFLLCIRHGSSIEKCTKIKTQQSS